MPERDHTPTIVRTFGISFYDGSMENYIRYSYGVDKEESRLIAAFMKSQDYAQAVANNADIVLALEQFESTYYGKS